MRKALARGIVLAVVGLPALAPATSIDQAEVVFDDESAAEGSGTSLDVSAIAFGIYTLSGQVPLSGFDDGAHAMHVRAHDPGGEWSALATQGFFVRLGGPMDPAHTVSAAEYWFDAAPAAGSGQALEVVTLDQLGIVGELRTVHAGALAPGFHVLGVRARDSGGEWSAGARQGWERNDPARASGMSTIASAGLAFAGAGNTVLALSLRDETTPRALATASGMQATALLVPNQPFLLDARFVDAANVTHGQVVGGFNWTDTDFDGYMDPVDAFPLDVTDWADMDGDGVGNNADPDTDGDGIPNVDDGDDDNDGMPDAHEAAHGHDPRDPADADRDEDGDGLGNLQEYQRGTDPHNPDTDGDGIPDNEDPTPAGNGLSNLTDGANDDSRAAVMDAPGRFVVFQSAATNLGAGDTNGHADIYRADTQTGAVARVSVDGNGSQIDGDSIEPSVSADGGRVVFVVADAAVAKVSGEPAKERVSRGKSSSWGVYLRNVTAGTTHRVGTALPGGTGTTPAIAPGGTAIAFTSIDPATELPQVYHVQLPDGAPPTVPVCVTCMAIDAVHGTETAVAADGASGRPAISADGWTVAFQTEADNLLANRAPPCGGSGMDVMLRNMQSGRLQVVAPPAPGRCDTTGTGSSQPSLDWTGHTVAFETTHPLLPGDGAQSRDVYVADMRTGTAVRASAASGGGDGNGDSTTPRISGDGSSVAFVSSATNLDPGEADTNGHPDVFVASLQDGKLTSLARLGRNINEEEVDGASAAPALSYNGTSLVFESDADNLSTSGQLGVRNVLKRSNPLRQDVVFATGFE